MKCIHSFLCVRTCVSFCVNRESWHRRSMTWSLDPHFTPSFYHCTSLFHLLLSLKIAPDASDSALLPGLWGWKTSDRSRSWVWGPAHTYTLISENIFLASCPYEIHWSLKKFFFFFLTQSQRWRTFFSHFHCFCVDGFENADVTDSACTCAMQFPICHKCTRTPFIIAADQVVSLWLVISNLIMFGILFHVGLL